MNSRDDKTIKRLTCGEQQLEYMKLLRSQDPRVTTVWKFHGERRPCKVVSIRALDQYFASQPPRFGNRLAVQALVRFDTLQVCKLVLSSEGYVNMHHSTERGAVLQKDRSSRFADRAQARGGISCVPEAYVV